MESFLSIASLFWYYFMLCVPDIFFLPSSQFITDLLKFKNAQEIKFLARKQNTKENLESMYHQLTSSRFTAITSTGKNIRDKKYLP